MLSALFHVHLAAGQMTIQAPPRPEPGQTETTSLPDAPSQLRYPIAVAIPEQEPTVPVHMESVTQSEHNGVFSLDQDVVITYRDHIVHADHIDYDTNTGELTASGHLQLTGGPNDESIAAAHGVYNTRTETGTFYEVSGSVAIRSSPARTTAQIYADPGTANASRVVYTNGSPFLFKGRMVVKTGPMNYDVYDGSVTSCQLPRPDWILSGAHFSVDDTKAKAFGSTFHLLNLPVLYLPYVTHPTDPNDRQSGFLIPTIGESSTKGLVIGEQIYMVLGRSADLTVGSDYYSLRGFAESASFRYRGQGLNFVRSTYTGLLDRLQGAANQGGEDVLFAGRRDLSPDTRAAANIEYLSSYIYREAFAENFNDAVTSDIISTAYLTHDVKGYEFAGLADRYQGIKLIAEGTTPQQQVRIFHVPTLSFSTTDHTIDGSGLEYTMDASGSGLKRTQPGLITSGVVERFDLHPQIAYPFSFFGWRVRPSIAGRETLYSRSRLPNGQVPVVAGSPAPVESLAGLARSDFEGEVEVRPPVLARTFDTPDALKKLFGDEVRHTIEPEVTYRYTGGVNDFKKVLRFDETDIVSNTNEVEYGLTQRLFRHSDTTRPCHAEELPQGPGFNSEAVSTPVPDDTPGKGCGNEELISWRVTQKYFLDPTFGGAVVDGRRNIFTTTLDLSGVAFLTEPRNISPLVSRLRVRTSAYTDVEWDFDYDTGAKKFTADNVFVDLHRGSAFGALSYARLNAPGRFYTDGVSSTVSSFEQMRVLLGYGDPAKRGLSAAGNAGIDLCPATPAAPTTAQPSASCTLLQYAALQASYNWDCCGLSVEYRKYELGAVRDEGVYRFNFTLANIGTAGNLRRAERLF